MCIVHVYMLYDKQIYLHTSRRPFIHVLRKIQTFSIKDMIASVIYLQVRTCMGDKRVVTIQEWLVDSYFIYLNVHCSFKFLLTSPYRFVCVWFPSSIRCRFAWWCQREDIENTLPQSVKLHPSFHPAKRKLATYNVSKCWGSLPAKQMLKRIHSNHACIPIISSMIYLHTNLP